MIVDYDNSKKSKKNAETRQRAATLLVESGHFENAEALYNSTGLFEEVKSLILNNAPDMMAQGQFSLLKNLIDSLPDEHHSPWILYWTASASLSVDPHTARHGYEAALLDFENIQDINGICLSWAGIVDSLIFAHDDIRSLDQWIKWMRAFLQENPEFPSAEIESRVVLAMFCSLMYHQPQHPDLPVWAQRLGKIMQQLPGKNRRLAIATHYKSLQAATELGTPYPEALNCIAMGGTLIELAEYEKAESWLTKASTLADQISSSFLSFNLHLTRAELYYVRGDNEAGKTALTQAMVIGRQKNHLNTDWWRPSAMCGLCIKALENNIEVDYVQQLIKTHKLYPDSPPLHLDNWPWQVRVYTLGRFSVLHDGKPLSINGNGKNKPIELLKALIAMGGRDVSEVRICEALWPDAEGDNAHSSFTSTLSRLRKLLGNDILQVHNAQLSLNDHLCWLDIWAYERSLGELESALSDPDTEQIINIEKKIHRLFDLYHGLFMEKEPQLGWMLPQRERLQIKLLRIIKQLISFFSSKGRCKRVIALYEKARELDPLSEEYYRGLMRCHAALGNDGEALAIYENCQSILHITFDIKPSGKTTQLFNQIKTGDKKQLKRACEHCAHSAG